DSDGDALLLLPAEGEDSAVTLTPPRDETAPSLGLLPPAGVDEESAPPIDLARLSTMSPAEGGIRDDFWRGDNLQTLETLISSPLADPGSPALRRLLRRFLLSAPEPPPAIAETAPTASLGEVPFVGETEDGDGDSDGDNEGVADSANNTDETDDAASRAHFLWRVEQLARFGMWKDLDRLLSLLPRSRLGGADESGAALLALRLDAMILAGRHDDVCAEARLAAEFGAESDARLRARVHRVQVACQIRDRDDDIALLGLDLLRETDIPAADESPSAARAREEFFALASMRLGFGSLPAPLEFSALNLFLLDGAEGVDLVAAFAEDGAITAPALLGLAYGRHLVLSLRAGFAERAAENGILATDDLADFYESFVFDDLALARAAAVTVAETTVGDGDGDSDGDGDNEGVGAAEEANEENEEDDDYIARAASFDGPEQRAYVWQAASLLGDFGARAELARFALESARGEGLEVSTALLWRDLLLEIPAEARLGGDAEAAARLLLLSDAPARARDWTALLAAAQDREADLTLLRLWPEARLGGLDHFDLGGARLDDWSAHALGALPSREAAAREIHLRGLLEGLGASVSAADWAALGEKLRDAGRGDPAASPETSEVADDVRTRAVASASGVETAPDVVDAGAVAGDPSDPGRLSFELLALRRALADAARDGRRGEAFILLLELHHRHLALSGAVSAGAAGDDSAAVIDSVALLEGRAEILSALRVIGFSETARGFAREIWRDAEDAAAAIPPDGGR
ncbi:MAG: hypothetical protein MPJ53_00580, partial [Alphaproteobacteria bacterium]|nr:hypothetical protein [Alphaproteobacteria bacterium]